MLDQSSWLSVAVKTRDRSVLLSVSGHDPQALFRSQQC